MKLNIGSGTNRKDDYLGVDLYSDVADIKLDATKPLPFEDESVDAIYTSHFIEHLTRKEWDIVREDWLRILKLGAEIEILCPNIALVCENYLSNADKAHWERILYGLQTHEGEYHKSGHSINTLAEDFEDHFLIALPPTTGHELHVRIKKA